MVVVAFLHRADFALEPQNGRAVFAHDTGRRRRVGKGRVARTGGSGDRDRRPLTRKDLGAIGTCAAVGRWIETGLFGDAFGKGGQNLRVVAQITRLDELQVRVGRGDAIGEAIDAVDQDTREQEIREHDDTFVAQSGRVGQAGFDQRKGNAGKADLKPAEAKTFVQHPGDFRDIAIGVGIGCAAPDDDEAGVVAGDRAVPGIGLRQRVFDTLPGGGDHPGVDAQFAPVMDVDIVSGGIGVENGGNVVFRVHRGEEHSGDGENAVAACVAQAVEAVANDRVGEFKVAVVNHPVGGQQGRQFFGQHGEFVDSGLRAGAMAADHDACLHAVCSSSSGDSEVSSSSAWSSGAPLIQPSTAAPTITPRPMPSAQ